MYSKRLILFALALIFILPLVAGEDIRFVAQAGANVNIREPCINNGTYCSGSAVCNLTVWNPSNNLILDNKVMTNSIAFHNYTLNSTQTATVGEYENLAVCCDGSQCGYDTFFFELTPNGERTNTAKAMLYLGLFIILVILMGLSLWAHFADKGIIWKIWWFSAVWLMAIAVSFIAWNMSADFLTSAPFITSIFKIIFYALFSLFLPFLFLMVVYTGYVLFWESKFRELMEGRGFSREEAEEYMSRRKKRR